MEKVQIVDGKPVRVDLLGDEGAINDVEDLRRILRNGGYRGDELEKLTEFLILWSDELSENLKRFNVL